MGRKGREWTQFIMLPGSLIYGLSGSLSYSFFAQRGGDVCLQVSSDNRMFELLWFVGYCRDFPAQLADRLDGHPEWNRHVKYAAVKRGYVTVYRDVYRQRVIRSLRLLPAGLEYIGKRDPKAMSFVMASQDTETRPRNEVERIMRRHAQATALIMAYHAGAKFLPGEKPSLLSGPSTTTVPYDPNEIYYYSSHDLREAITEQSDLVSAKSSRLLGVIVHKHYCHCLYFTGHSRMFWLAGTEENMSAMVQQVLNLRGIPVSVFNQVIIGSRMSVARKLMRREEHTRSRYFSLSPRYNSIFYITNDHRGDELLSIIVDPQKQVPINRLALEDYIPPRENRFYDALTADELRPVILGYTCDLITFSNMSAFMPGFSEPTIVLCYDYQLNTIQFLVETPTEVRVMKGGDTP